MKAARRCAAARATWCAPSPSPSMTRGIWNDPQRYIETYWSRFPGMWYHGDWASVDEDGHWFLHGRADESMNVAGRKVGPAEVEEAMLRHPGVAEAAVIGVPDELKGEAIMGYAVAEPGRLDGRRRRMRHRGLEAGPRFRPREVIVVADLPKTQSGKIVRRLIRRKYLGEELAIYRRSRTHRRWLKWGRPPGCAYALVGLPVHCRSADGRPGGRAADRGVCPTCQRPRSIFRYARVDPSHSRPECRPSCCGRSGSRRCAEMRRPWRCASRSCSGSRSRSRVGIPRCA